jgi:hypothetical protein
VIVVFGAGFVGVFRVSRRARTQLSHGRAALVEDQAVDGDR